MAIRILQKLKELFGLPSYGWPEGEPLISHGFRWGTKTPDGSTIYAPGVSIEFLPICSRCQQAIESVGDQDEAAGINGQPKGVARLSVRQGKSSRLVAIGLGLATAANVAAIVAAKADIRITADPGGSLAVYRAKVEAARASGERVVIDGTCNSACTLYLSLPENQICVTPRARFGFHAAINSDTGFPNPRETDALWHSYPPKVQIAIGKRGGLWIQAIYVPGREIARGCR